MPSFLMSSSPRLIFSSREPCVLSKAGSRILSRIIPGQNQKMFTYSLEDPEANFDAYRIEDDEGGLKVSVIYQPEDDKRRGLRERLLSKKDSTVSAKFTVRQGGRNDALSVVKAFAVGMSLGIEPHHMTKAVAAYASGGAEQEKDTAPKQEKAADRGSERRREKEVDFD